MNGRVTSQWGLTMAVSLPTPKLDATDVAGVPGEVFCNSLIFSFDLDKKGSLSYAHHANHALKGRNMSNSDVLTRSMWCRGWEWRWHEGRRVASLLIP